MIIYKATNITNNKCYIGQTIKSLRVRMLQHLYDARNNRYNFYFHKAIRKYGQDSFHWDTLCECASKEELDEMEYHYIKQYQAFGKGGYNLTMGGEGIVGYRHTEEQMVKMRERADLVIKNGLQKGKNNPCYGRCGMDNPATLIWKVTRPDGVTEIIVSMMKYCEQNNLTPHHMYDIAAGRGKTHRGYRCEKMNINNTDIISYVDIPEASKWVRLANEYNEIQSTE